MSDTVVESWKCPTCGLENFVTHHCDRKSERQIKYCDTERGGCGEMYVIETTMVVNVTGIYRPALITDEVQP